MPLNLFIISLPLQLPTLALQAMKEVPGTEKLWECDLVLLAMGFLGPESTFTEQLKVWMPIPKLSRVVCGVFCGPSSTACSMHFILGGVWHVQVRHGSNISIIQPWFDSPHHHME